MLTRAGVQDLQVSPWFDQGRATFPQFARIRRAGDHQGGESDILNAFRFDGGAARLRQSRRPAQDKSFMSS